jgi:hypothetical protein
MGENETIVVNETTAETYATYKLPLTGDQVRDRLLQKIPSTTDDVEGGTETWLFKCGNAESTIE